MGCSLSNHPSYSEKTGVKREDIHTHSSPETSVSPSPETSVSPSTETSVSPSTETSVSPSPETSVSPSTETSVSPSTETSVSPSTETSVSPSTETSVSPSPETSVSPSTETSVSPSPETSVSPSTETSVSPSPETSVSPSPETSVSPSPETSVSPSPETSVSPSPETSVSPSPETSVSPSPETSVSPSPETSVAPSPETSVAPSPVASVATSPMASLAHSPVASVAPSPVASVAPSPVASVAYSPVASVAPSPVASVAPSPVASVAPSPVVSVAPSSVATSVNDDFAIASAIAKESNEEQLHKYILSIWNARKLHRNILVAIVAGVRIYSTTVKFLQNKISDEVIDAYMMTRVRRKEITTQYLPCSVMSLIFDPSMQHKVMEMDIENPELCGMINVRGQHWIFCFMDMKSRDIVIIDPLGENWSTLQRLLQSWIRFMELQSRNSSWRVRTVLHSKQMDSTSCGIFCLKFAENFLQGRTLNVFDKPDDIQAYRIEVLKEILQNQDITTPSLGCIYWLIMQIKIIIRVMGVAVTKCKYISIT
ncbi:coiled-coil domain-containing protein 8 homolog isoform X2 [Argopecten irradians]|uniref:coiled-coil domain-containing protein 8 homolog isoform X2 n=1 Tax=Argopecten irradians TaxID=31199 RepID=UPI00371BE6C6